MTDEDDDIATFAHTETWARITVHQGVQSGQVYDRVPLPAVLGRGKDTNVRLADDSEHPTMSRRHVLVAVRGPHLVIQDLSTNGTRLGTTRLVPGETVPLPENVPVWLGTATMITVEKVAADAPTAPPSLASPLFVPEAHDSPTLRNLTAAGAVLDIRTLGLARIFICDLEVPDPAWQTRKAVVLLVYLALHPGAPQDPDHLCERIWPEAEASSRATLQSTVSRIRRAIRSTEPDAPDPIAHVRKGYALSSVLKVQLDASRFEALCANAERAPVAERKSLLTQAVGVYAGPFLEGYTEEWIELHRTRLQHLFLTALQQLSWRCETDGQATEAVRHYQRILVSDPCWEAAHAGLMRCMAANGQREEAVRQYFECSRLLMKHLNLGPGAEVQRLYQSLTGGEPRARL